MKKDHISVSVILPTFNEADNIIPLIELIRKNTGSNLKEVIVVDDNSPDGTGLLVKKRYRTTSCVKVIIRKQDNGLARSILAGIGKSRGEYILVMDTDFNHNPNDIPGLMAKITQYDLVIGSRYIKGGGMENKIRNTFSYLYNLLIRILLCLKTHDNLSGFFLMKKSLLKNIDTERIFTGYGDYFIRLLSTSNRLNYSIAEIPVFYKNRPAGKSKSVFLTMFVDYSRTILDIILSR